jgi:hypothetical protein
MEKNTINFKGKEYEIKEPTISQWTKLSTLKEFSTEIEFTVMLIAELTGLTKEQVDESNWQEVLLASEKIQKIISNDGNKFFNEFEHEGVKYKFLDINNLSFGEFIDIDSYFSKPQEERLREMNLLMAFFYREVGEDGKITKYDSSKIGDRAEIFKNLPVKYVNGSTSFFLLIERGLQDNSLPFLSNKKSTKTKLKEIYLLVRLIVLVSIGVGSVRWLLYRKKILQKLGR